MSLESSVKMGVAVRKATVKKIVDASGNEIKLPFAVDVIIDGTSETPLFLIIKALCHEFENVRDAVETGKEDLKNTKGGE